MTKVIFRKDVKHDNEIVAFFPETYNNGTLTCYAHIGQHSDASIYYYLETKKASPMEYADLLEELEKLVGYDDLKIMQRMTF